MRDGHACDSMGCILYEKGLKKNWESPLVGVTKAACMGNTYDDDDDADVVKPEPKASQGKRCENL